MRVLGLVPKPLYDFSDHIRVGLMLQEPNVTWGVQPLYVLALSFLIHSKMELNSMKNHFKIDPNIYCSFIDTVGSQGVPETCLGGSGAMSGRTWAPRGRVLRFSGKF